MNRYKRNYISKYGLLPMLEVMFSPILYLYRKWRYKDAYERFKEVKVVMLNIVRLQKQYIAKVLNYATGRMGIDYNTVPLIWYTWDMNKIMLKVQFRQRIKQKDVDNFLEELRFATQLKTIDYRAENLFLYVSLVSNAGNPKPYFIQDCKAIPIGTRYGLPVEWNYNKYPHMLVVGETGEGKTSLVYYLMSSILSNFDVYCIDGKDVDYWALRDKFVQYAGINNHMSCFDILREFQAQMQERYILMKKHENVMYTELDLAPVFLFIDEFPSVVEAMDTSKVRGQKYSQRDEFLRIDGDLIRRGRAAGFFLIKCMQRADAKYIGGDTRDNMRLKIALGSATGESYAMLFGSEHRNLEELQQGQGYFKMGNELSIFSYYHMREVELDKQLISNE